jgi:hypothetical protein
MYLLIWYSFGRRAGTYRRRPAAALSSSTILTEELRVGSASFGNMRLYADGGNTQDGFYAGEAIDAITGNALLWDKIVVIDYRNGKFGMR